MVSDCTSEKKKVGCAREKKLVSEKKEKNVKNKEKEIERSERLRHNHVFIQKKELKNVYLGKRALIWIQFKETLFSNSYLDQICLVCL